ncbi:MAG: hypothetical protein KDD25_08225, partial [Bdellovibrionales bacterium]|nr:hypothetical protein [Bdellovibrionales bacterium]
AGNESYHGQSGVKCNSNVFPMAGGQSICVPMYGALRSGGGPVPTEACANAYRAYLSSVKQGVTDFEYTSNFKDPGNGIESIDALLKDEKVNKALEIKEHVTDIQSELQSVVSYCRDLYRDNDEAKELQKNRTSSIGKQASDCEIVQNTLATIADTNGIKLPIEKESKLKPANLTDQSTAEARATAYASAYSSAYSNAPAGESGNSARDKEVKRILEASKTPNSPLFWSIWAKRDLPSLPGSGGGGAGSSPSGPSISKDCFDFDVLPGEPVCQAAIDSETKKKLGFKNKLVNELAVRAKLDAGKYKSLIYALDMRTKKYCLVESIEPANKDGNTKQPDGNPIASNFKVPALLDSCKRENENYFSVEGKTLRVSRAKGVSNRCKLNLGNENLNSKPSTSLRFGFNWNLRRQVVDKMIENEKNADHCIDISQVSAWEAATALTLFPSCKEKLTDVLMSYDGSQVAFQSDRFLKTGSVFGGQKFSWFPQVKTGFESGLKEKEKVERRLHRTPINDRTYRTANEWLYGDAFVNESGFTKYEQSTSSMISSLKREDGTLLCGPVDISRVKSPARSLPGSSRIQSQGDQ